MPYIKKFNVDASKSPEEIIEDMNHYLRHYSKLRKVLSSKISTIDKEVVKLYHLKRKMEEQIVSTQKCRPATKNTKRSKPQPQPKSISSMSGEQLYSSMTAEQKEAIKNDLMSGTI